MRKLEEGYLKIPAGTKRAAVNQTGRNEFQKNRIQNCFWDVERRKRIACYIIKNKKIKCRKKYTRAHKNLQRSKEPQENSSLP